MFDWILNTPLTGTGRKSKWFEIGRRREKMYYCIQRRI